MVVVVVYGGGCVRDQIRRGSLKVISIESEHLHGQGFMAKFFKKCRMRLSRAKEYTHVLGPPIDL